MKRRFLSILMAMAMCLSVVPMTAFAEELPAESEYSAPADLDEAVEEVQSLINDLPSVNSVTEDDYDLVQDAYDAYDALSEEQQALIVGAEVFEDLFEWFNAQTAPIDSSYVAISNEEGFSEYLSDGKLGDGHYKLTSDVTITSTIKVYGDVILDLNGHVLKFDSSVYGGSASGCVIEVNATGDFVLTDSDSDAKHYFYAKTGSDLWRWDADAEESSSQPDDTAERQYKTVEGGVITGGINGNGGGIVVWGGLVGKDVTFTMKGGSIIGCSSNYGGGVYVGNNHANFTMEGGEIAGCAASSEGGGVYVEEGTVFDMKGGKIHDCVSPRTAENAHGLGGGVCNHGTFSMTDATIENCKVYTKETVGGSTKEEGGGVYSSGTFKMKNSKIIGCDAGNGTGDGILLSGDSAKLKDIINGEGYILKSNDNTEINLEGKSCGNVTCMLCSHGSFDEDGECEECGLSFVAEVTKTEDSVTTKTYIAAGAGDNEGYKGVMDALGLYTIDVKLLVDVTGAYENGVNPEIKGEHTLDLNGHKFETSDKIEISKNNAFSTLTIKDSSEAKSGEIKLAGIEVGCYGKDVSTLNIESGKMTVTATRTEAEDREPSVVVRGAMTVSGTVELGTNTYILVNPNSADGEASLTVNGGNIIGDVEVGEYGKLTVSSGSIKNLKVTDGEAQLTGGSFGTITMGDEAGSVFDIIPSGYAYFNGVKDAETGAVSRGTIIQPTTETKTLGDGTAPVVVSAHTCNFVQGADGKYTCTADDGCGRSYGQEPVAYIDYVDGKEVEKLCTEYVVVTGIRDEHNATHNFYMDSSKNEGKTWFVVKDDVNVSMLEVANGPIHLILCDGKTLTAEMGVYGEGESLTVYGQSNGTGKLVASNGEYSKDNQGIGLYGIWIKDITVNGGIVEATGGNSQDGTSNTYGIYYKNKFTVNGGKVVAKGGDIGGNSASDSYGIYVYSGSFYSTVYAYINGGEVEATGGKITGEKTKEEVYEYSYGFAAYDSNTLYAYVNGGKLTATGGAFDISSGASNKKLYSESIGLKVRGDLTVNGGIINANGGNATVTITNGSEKNVASAASYGIFVTSNLYLNKGTINPVAGTATVNFDAPLKSSCISEKYDIRVYNNTTISGGTMKLKDGYFNRVCVRDNAKFADLLAEGYAYWNQYTQEFFKSSNFGDDALNNVRIKPCTHSASSGTCEYCGKDLGSSSGGSSSGGSSAPSNPTVSTETITMPDGTTIKTETKKDGTVVETTTKPDGSTTITETKTETKADGTTVETKKTTTSDGSSSATTTTTDENGTKTVSNVTVGGEAVKGGNTVTLPVDEVKPASGNNSNEIKINVPNGGATVEIPVENPTPGTIVVIVNEDGTETIVSGAKVTENGIQVTLKENATVKVVDATKEFGDVKEEDYFANAVIWAAANGITGGIDKNNFGPHLSCSRAQLVTFLWRAAGCPETSHTTKFDDMAEGEYYFDAVRWATSLGIVSGYGNGKFGTEDAITREQMAVILYRFAKIMGMDTTQGGMAVREYTDFENISGYALEAMQWAVNAGILQGYNNSLMPNEPCTRAQIVSMLYRLLGK